MYRNIRNTFGTNFIVDITNMLGYEIDVGDFVHLPHKARNGPLS